MLVCLCVDEADTAAAWRLAADDIATWSVSAVEIASAIELKTTWTEITALAAVRERALRLVATHSLRVADAMQLAAALVAVSDRPRGHEFVCADGRLRDADARESFAVADAVTNVSG